MNLADLHLTPRKKYIHQQSYYCNRCYTEVSASKEELEAIDNHPTMLCGGIMRVSIPTNTIPVKVRDYDTHIRVTNFCKNCADTL